MWKGGEKGSPIQYTKTIHQLQVSLFCTRQDVYSIEQNSSYLVPTHVQDILISQLYSHYRHTTDNWVTPKRILLVQKSIIKIGRMWMHKTYNDGQHVGLFINHDVAVLKIVVTKTNPVVITWNIILQCSNLILQAVQPRFFGFIRRA